LRLAQDAIKTRITRRSTMTHRWEDCMNLKHLFVALTTASLILGSSAAEAGQSINDVGAIACVNDKWDVKEPEKGHKLIDYAGRCVNIPDNAAAPKSTADCVGKYEYMTDGSWKGRGTCTYTYKDGDKLNDSWEEGSHLKEYTYKNTGGTGKYEKAGGGGTYTLEELTDTLLGGKYKGTMELP
jgi:hypothetical protein